MRVSVICTILNEGESIRRLMDSLVVQTRPPDEVVIVDGGSRDNTVAIVREYADRLPLRILVEPGANISRGRNIAIGAATGDVIASVDAGVWLEVVWLERLIAPLAGLQVEGSTLKDPCEHVPAQPPTFILQPSTCAGFFRADPQTAFEVAMGATVLPTEGEVKPETFLPSSRSVAFAKILWQRIGGYPEWLDYCEDLIFDLRLREAAGPFAWAPGAVAHFRPRDSMRAFFKQYYRYARGDGKADLWRKRHAVRYLSYLVALPMLLVLSIVHSPLWLLALLAGFLIYCRTPYRRLWLYLPELSLGDRAYVIALVPVIRVIGDVAKMLGYPAGWLWRLKNWRRPEIHWQKADMATR